MTYRSRSEKVLSVGRFAVLSPAGLDYCQERSNYSVCGLYGTGQDAEVQVLRKAGLAARTFFLDIVIYGC